MTFNGFPAWTPSRQFRLSFQESLVLTITSEAWSCVCFSIHAGPLLLLQISQSATLPQAPSLPGLSCISGDFPIQTCSAALSNISRSPELPTCPGAPGQDNQTTSFPLTSCSFPAPSHVCPEPINVTALLFIMPCSIGNLSQLSLLESFASDPPLTLLHLQLFCNTHSNLWSKIVCANLPFITC